MSSWKKLFNFEKGHLGFAFTEEPADIKKNELVFGPTFDQDPPDKLAGSGASPFRHLFKR